MAKARLLDEWLLRSFRFCLPIIPFLCSSHLLADAIVVSRAMLAGTIAEIFIEDDTVRIELEIGLSGLPAFRNILPDEMYRRLGYAEEVFADRYRRFFEHDMMIFADGRALPGRVTAIAVKQRAPRDEITGEELPVPADAENILRIELHYAFEGRPGTLSIKAPTDVAPVDIGFVLYHKNVPLNDFRYLGREQTATLDWDDPWYSSFNMRNLRRRYSAPMNGFIYIEPFEVRKEIIVRPKDLQRWVDLGLDSLDTIPAGMQGDIKLKVAGFLAQHHPVSINGERVAGELDRVHFLERTLRSSRIIEPPQDLDINSAVMGVIFAYPIRRLPDTVTLHWDLWDERIDRVPVSAVDEAGPFVGYVDRDDPDVIWRNFLTNPTVPALTVIEPPPSHALVLLASWRWALVVLAVAPVVWLIVQLQRSRNIHRPVAAVLVTAGLSIGAFKVSDAVEINDVRSTAVVTGLLKNVYHAFDFRLEDDIYDVLNHSVDGDLLTDIYLEMQRGLVLANQGGARAKVKTIDLKQLDTNPRSDGDGFIAHTTWVVTGTVGHWGHVHQRANRYRADLLIEPIDGVWKLTAMDVQEEERL